MSVDSSVFIAPNAILKGNILIGKDSSIWFGCVLRSENNKLKIGEGTNIQDLTVIDVDADFPVTIGNEVIIGHRSIIHGCTIGDNTLIGMGAIILNGSSIGSFCIVGAGAVVPEGMIIPDYSVVMGIPARIVKQVTPAQIEKIKRNAQTYINLKNEYLEGRW